MVGELKDYIRILLKKKLLLVIIWGCILALHTWTENLGDLLRLQSIGFRWISSPNYLSFFNFTDITRIHHDFVVVKTGHFIGFAIFDLLLFNWKKNHKVAIAIAVIFALTTEVLQLFMGRDGRLYDLMIDSLGVMTVYYILKSNLFNNPI
jgi:hypothetical protein